MDIFILEDYITSRREMKKQQSQKSRQQKKQKFQIQIGQISSHDGSLLPTPRDSPSGLTSTAAMTSSSSSVATSAFASAATRFPNASAEGRAFSTDHLFESFKPY